MTISDTVSVWSDFEIRLEVGLVRGVDREHKSCLAPGPEHRTFELHRGLNTKRASCTGVGMDEAQPEVRRRD